MLTHTILRFLLLLFLATLSNATPLEAYTSLKAAILDANWDLVDEMAKEFENLPRPLSRPKRHEEGVLAFSQAFLDAASQGRLDVLQRLVKDYGHLLLSSFWNDFERKGLRSRLRRTFLEAFINACAGGQAEVISWLLQVSDTEGLIFPIEKANIWELSMAANRTLQQVARTGNLQAIKAILDQPGLKLERLSGSLDAVVASLEAGQTQITDLLMSDSRLRAISGAKITLQDKFNQACIEGDLEVVKQAILAGADPSADHSYGFLRACELGHQAVFEYLCAGFPMDLSHGNYYALRKSFENGYRDIVIALIEKDSVMKKDYQEVLLTLLSDAINREWETVALVIMWRKVEGFQASHLLSAISHKLYKVAEVLFSHIHIDGSGVDDLLQTQIDDSTMMDVLWRTKLVYAILDRNLEEVIGLIERGVHLSSENFNRACERGGFEIVNYLLPKYSGGDLTQCIRMAILNGQADVVKAVLADGRFESDFLNTFDIFTCSLSAPKVLEVLLGDGRLNPTIQENYIFQAAMETGNFEAAKILFRDPRVRGTKTSNLVLQEKVRKLIGIREWFEVREDQIRKDFEEFLREWDLAVSIEKTMESMAYPFPEEPEPMEKFICNVFFDSYSSFFERDSIQLYRTQEICDVFQKMLRFASSNIGSDSADISKIESVSKHIQEIKEIADIIEETAKFGKNDRISQRDKFIQSKISQMSVYDKLHIPTRNFNHLAIGVLEKSDTGFNWYMFNSGDGTAFKVEGSLQRLHMFEIFYGISQEWFTGMFAKIDSETPFRDLFYPQIGTHYISKATVRGQKSGTCIVRTFQLFLLSSLGRPLYTKFKFVLLSNLLENVYSSLSAGSSEISYLGVTFQSNYMPVWAMVRELGLFEDMIERHIGKLDAKPVVSVSGYEPDADEAYKTNIEETKEFCWRIHAHLKELLGEPI